MKLLAGMIVSMTFALHPEGAAARDGSQACNGFRQELAEQDRQLEGRRLHEALFRAAALDCPTSAQDLLARGASVQARNGQGASAFAIAASQGSVDVAELLLDAGADLTLRDLSEATPLLRASKSGRRRMVDWLLSNGAMVDAHDKQGITPLIAASFNGDLRIINVLLDAGAQVNAQDVMGKSALSYAAGRAYPIIVSRLISAGAYVSATDAHNLTPLSWVAGHANDAPAEDGIATATILLDAGAAVTHPDDRGRDALMIAAGRGHETMVNLLLSRGADAARRDLKGLRAADLASFPDIAALLP
jgi:ankyrin repeat protein